MHEFSRFIPTDHNPENILANYDLTPVIDRLGKVFPLEKVWEAYASDLHETGGRTEFPYYRVDTSLMIIKNSLLAIERYQLKDKEFDNCYEKASSKALETLAWVEVGFQGLDNLVHSSASTNWTSGMLFHTTEEERIQTIMLEGKAMYEKVLLEFAEFRKNHRIIDDCFRIYNAEYLLDSLSQGVSSDNCTL